MKKLMSMFFRPSVVAFFALTLCGHVSASEPLVIKGFIAQGVQQASESNFINEDGDVSVAMTEIGLNARYPISQNLSINGQLVYINSGDRYPEGGRVDYLFVDWSVVSNPSWNVNLHFGRYKNYHWIYSATRDVPHTRPGNLLPQSIYFDSFRDIALGSDGIALRANTTNALGDWEVNWSYGRSPINKKSTQQLLGHLSTGDVEQDYVHQLSTTWRSYQTGLMLGINYLDSDFTYNRGDSDPFIDGDANVQRVSLMGQYQSEFWEFTSEVMRESSRFENALFPGFVSDSIAEGGYAQLMLLPNARWSGLLRLDLYDLNREDRNGNQLSELAFGQIPNYFGYMDTGTVGARYNILDNLAVQVEYNRIRGAGRLTPLLVKNPLAAPSEYWDLWSVQLMYWF